VEGYVGKVWPDYLHAVIQTPDPKKGEQLVLITTNPKANRNDLVAYAKQNDISELNIPKIIRIIDKIPVLGIGKTNYVELMNTSL